MAWYEGILEDTGAKMDVNCVEQYNGMSIDRDLRLVASRLYTMGVTRPWTSHVQPCHHIIPLFRCRSPGLHKSVQE